MTLAKQFPQINFIIQDVNQAGLKMGRELAEKDHDIQGRVHFAEHDFFQPQTVRAEVYFFRQILHDWSDEDCVKIIRALIPALENETRVLLSEAVLPQPPGTRSALLEDKHVW